MREIRTAAVFGASGKLGRRVVAALGARGVRVRALQHQSPPLGQGVERVFGSITDARAVAETVRGADLVIQLATAKENRERFFDVSIKGTFNVLESCRDEPIAQLILIGGDAAFGIWFYPQPIPIDEQHPYTAYPGYYAFSKVIEEVMARQYALQYGLPLTILRCSWVFANDDLLDHFSLLRNVDPAEPGHGFGAVSAEAYALVAAGHERVPILCDAGGAPLRRHIVHIDDVMQALALAVGNPAALGGSFNIAGPAAFGYDVAAAYLARRTGLPTIELACPQYHSFEINITRARSVLGYQPENDIHRMVDRALAHRKEHAHGKDL